jgi:hypothetical protein
MEAELLSCFPTLLLNVGTEGFLSEESDMMMKHGGNKRVKERVKG